MNEQVSQYSRWQKYQVVKISLIARVESNDDVTVSMGTVRQEEMCKNLDL